MMKALLQPGKIVTLRGREWVVLPSESEDVLRVKPLGGSEEETTGIYLPLDISNDKPEEATFPPPSPPDLGDITTARLLYDSARLAFRNGAGPFRSLARLSFRPRAYQMVPLIMALRQEVTRLFIADDVGVGKTIEALLIIRELLERRIIKRFAVLCLPHLCEQWQEEIRAKLDLDPVIIRTNTQAALDRRIQGDTSVFQYYPFQIISIDYIKSDARCNLFIQECPELLIVDEVHTCARPSGAAPTQQQRHHLLSRLAANPVRHLVLLTATPHSGKPEEFQSLLGLIHSDFAGLDLPTSSPSERKRLARHFIQRKRADVEKWMGEDTPFPRRESFEYPYQLAEEYANFFDDLLDFTRKMVVPDPSGGRFQRVRYWSALALLRGVMSSPGAGVAMLNTRLEGIPPSDDNETDANPVSDTDFGFDGDYLPTQVLERADWSEYQRRQLRDFARRLDALGNARMDQKLARLAEILKDWLRDGLKPVVFCRYIETARYLGERLPDLLRKQFPRLELRAVTSEDPDDVRRQRIEEMSPHEHRVLVATDCLSEGVNLQSLFTAVLHYDLPWNPNRLEQREGRVDRFGQNAPLVKTALLYGENNQIDGIVLDVLLRKVREIKKSTGISVPFPEDSQSILDTITQALLLNPQRRVSGAGAAVQTTLFDLPEFSTEETALRENITRKLEEAAEREKTSRSIFAQNAIKAAEIEEDLRAMDEAIGNPAAVRDFVTQALQVIFGVQVRALRKGYEIFTGNLPIEIKSLLPPQPSVKVSFDSPTPEGFLYLGRNHRFVEQLCLMVMAHSLDRAEKRAARAAVIRTGQVSVKTTLLLLRCRNVIEQSGGALRIVAEEMLIWGWTGTPEEHHFLDHQEASQLLAGARATENLSPQSRAAFLENELKLLDALREEFDSVAEGQSRKLVEAHERFSAVMNHPRYQVVYPVLPMDILGIYILLPEAAS